MTALREPAADRCLRLAPDVLAVVEEGEHAAPPGPGVAGLRAAHDRDAAALAGPGPEMASVSDAVLPGPYGPIPVRVGERDHGHPFVTLPIRSKLWHWRSTSIL